MNPTLAFPGGQTVKNLPAEFHGQRSLEGYSPRGCQELDMTEQLTLSLSLFQIQHPGLLLPASPISLDLTERAEWTAIPVCGCLGWHEKQPKPEWPHKHVLSLSQPAHRKKILFMKSLPSRSQLLKLPDTLVWLSAVTQIKELQHSLFPLLFP